MPAKALQKRAQQQQSAAVAAKRELLASRQTCDAGYGYCYGKHVPPPYLQSDNYQRRAVAARTRGVPVNAAMTEVV